MVNVSSIETEVIRMGDVGVAIELLDNSFSEGGEGHRYPAGDLREPLQKPSARPLRR